MASVSVDRVWKYYGSTAAVKELALEVADGEFVAVLGPSGCGKSSTLRMLAGLEHISAGEIRFGSKRVNDLPPRDRDIAMVFENYALYPHKTVFDNMANPLKLRGVERSVIEDRVKKAAAILEIGHLLERRPGELSGGQKQRTAIGRAIVREPALFLFDEPIAHLDAKLRAHMRGELKLMQRKLGTTMIYVTHDQMEALSMADRIAVMNDGVLQQVGTPQQIYNHPVNAWVAGFVGEPPINFLDGHLAEVGGRLHFTHGSFQLPLMPEQEEIVRSGYRGDKVRMGVRPDQVTITTEPRSGAFQGRILVTEPIGGDMLVDVSLGGDKVLVKTSPDFEGAMDQPCYLTLDRGRWHLFGNDDGVALF
ncbi:MAG TPA: ABC transporter ATP-binding protein [Geminicoccus sp.]|jgi:multiple sugar transport system ATP-binding protein|uniref:ABC transporter ATP-binding protein n=1 Tax=Geminicoccus sp. TaxID=2024832 RepID=UPI002E319F08|nr:ABC transporter ATP-binding protein [Geminicoccus sp.]HEX2529285.1 ABC transporter ATP-binding protein [Geminicoccus sp.]